MRLLFRRALWLLFVIPVFPLIWLFMGTVATCVWVVAAAVDFVMNKNRESLVNLYEMSIPIPTWPR